MQEKRIFDENLDEKAHVLHKLHVIECQRNYKK